MLKNLRGVLSKDDEELIDNLDIGAGFDEAGAYALLLVDLAYSDGKFCEKEQAVVAGALSQIFPANAENVADIIESAKGYLSSFRNSCTFVNKIKAEYSLEERNRLYGLIDKVIQADGHADDIESYLQGKFRKILE